MRLQTSLLWCGAIVGLFLLVADATLAVEFSADYIKRENGKASRAQIYVKEDRCRIEHRSGVLTDLGYAGVSIARMDKQAVWLLLSKLRRYLVVPLRKDRLPPLSDSLEGETARTAIREETVSGFRTILYEVTVGAEPLAERYYQWVTVDHRLPIRTLSRDRDWAEEYEHVVFSKQPAYFFEVPLGYAEWKPSVTPSRPESRL